MNIPNPVYQPKLDIAGDFVDALARLRYGCVAFWNLADLTDATGNGWNLTNTGSVAFASGMPSIGGNAASFTNTAGQRLAMTPGNNTFNLATLNEFTIAGWNG